MFELTLAFLSKYKFIILFYAVIIILLLINRKKLDIQGKIIILYRMKWGLQWMDKYATKFREWVILLGYVGVGAGYVGLIMISYFLIKNLVDLVIKPKAVSTVSLVLPGTNVPGLGVLPFWYWIIAIFLIALIHEFSHGIVARAHNIKVKNTGIVFFGPILGAFVEPDEKKLRKESDIVQYSVLSAGSFSNILLAITSLIILQLLFLPVQQLMIEPESTGFTFETYVNESLPFAQAGIIPGTTISGINGKNTANFREFSEELAFFRPGETVTIRTAERDVSVTLAANPSNPKKSFLGIQNIKNKIIVKEQYQKGIGKALYQTVEWFTGMEKGLPGLLGWLFYLSFGIGLFNLLPLPIVDGGRMAQVFLHKLQGPEKGERRYRQISLFFLFILFLNFLPMIIKFFQSLF